MNKINAIKSLLLQSEIARRLVGRSIFLATVPVAVAVALLGYMGRSQIIWTAHTMERIQTQTAEEGQREYQQAGRQALHQAGRQTQAEAETALKSVSRRAAAIQDSALSATAQNFSDLARDSFEGAVRQSAETNRNALNGVRDETTRLFAASARDTQQRGAAGIERAMLAQADTLMQERARSIAKNMTDQLEDAKRYLKLTAQMPDMREGRAEGQKNILDALVRRFPQMSLVSALDKTGQETAMSAADRAVTAADLGKRSDSRYFRAAMRGADYLGDDGLPLRDNAPTLQIAIPIEAYHGKVVGVLEARYSLGELWDEIHAARVGKTGFASVQEGTGRFLLPPRPTRGALLTSVSPIEPLNWRVIVALPRDEAMQPIRTLKRDIAENAENAQRQMRRQIQAAAQNATARLQRDARQHQVAAVNRVQSRAKQALLRVKEFTARQTQEEAARLQRVINAQTEQTQKASSLRMARAADTVTAQMSARVRPLTQEALTDAARRLVFIAALLVVISSLVGSLLALFTASRIVRPVVELAQMTHAIAEGDLDQRVDESAPGEIGDLAAAFNMMSASLQQSRAELRDAEGQLVQSAKLASLGELSAGVAHELNQPLAIIRGVVQQLQDEPGLSADVLADLELVEGQTGRMIKIIQHMRTFCRMGGGEQEEFDLNGVIQNCFLLIGQQLRAHNVSVALELCENAPPIVGDANELEQVLINLVNNARDALAGRPDALITLRSRVEGNYFALEVRDNGPGIPEEIAARIFDPFFTTKEPGKGTGLGLSISHTIVAKHKGTLRVANEGGAVFTLRLPLAQSVEEALPLAA